MKPIVTIFLCLSWIALANGAAIAQQQNNRRINPSLKPTTNESASPAEQLKPVGESRPLRESIQQANTRIERKSFRTRTTIALIGEDQPRLVEPLCLNPCTPTLGPTENTPDGVGVLWPMKF